MKRSSIWLLLLLIPLYGFWISPTKDFLAVQQKKIDALEKERADKTQELLDLQALKKELEVLQAENKNAGMEPLRKLPLEIEQENILKDLQKIAHGAGFRFQGVSFSTGVSKDLGLPEIRMNFSVTGLKAQVPKFLESIEKNERFLGMDDLGVNVENNSGQFVTMNVSLYAFSQEALRP